MTSDVATLGLTFSGTDVQDFEGLFLEVVSGLYDGTDVRGEDVTIPYLEGQIPRARRLHTRRIMLKGFCRGSGATQDLRRLAYRASRTNAELLFAQDAMPDDLVVLYSDGSSRTITARTLNIIAIELVPSEYASLDIELLSTDPGWVDIAAGS
jgi:hypothetical protein